MIVASMSVAFADSDYKITVTNSNTNISIAGKTYTAYKLFDAVYSGNNASYTIKKNSKFFTDNAAKTILDKYFDFTTASGDDTIMVVTVKEAKQNATTKTLSDADVRALADELKAVLSGKDGISATVAAGAETVDIDVGAAGFYIVDGTAAAAEEGSTDNQGVVAAVALTNAKPTATVNPKADAPSIDKKITGIADGDPVHRRLHPGSGCCDPAGPAWPPESPGTVLFDSGESPGTVLFDSGTSPKGLCRQL